MPENVTDENKPEAIEAQFLRERTNEESEIVNMVEEMIDYYVRHYYPSRFEIIKAKHLFAGDEKIAIRETLGSSALNCQRHGLIDSVHDAFTKELVNQNFTPKLIPIHPKNRKYSDDAQDAYDWMYHRSKFETNISENAYSEAALIGDSYVFFGKEKKEKYEMPTAEHISFWEMFLEPMATSFNDSRKKVVRKIVDSIDVMKKYHMVDWDDKGDNAIVPGHKNRDVLTSSIDSAVYKTDFTKINDIAFYESEYDKVIKECCNGVDMGNQANRVREYFETGKVYEDLFAFGAESKLCEVIEVWEKTEKGNKVKVLVNGYLLPLDIELEYNPFGNIFFEDNVGSPIHRGIGHKLLPKQRECDLYLFVITNGVKMHAFPDWISESGVVDAANNEASNIIWSGEQKVYQAKKSGLQGRQPFQPIEYISKDTLNLTRILLQEAVQQAFSDIGINSYILGGDGRVERLSAAFNERTEQSRARLKTIKKSVSTALNTSYYTWLTILDKSFAKGLLERIDDDGKSHIKDLNVEDIQNNFEVLISSEGNREDTLKDMGQNILNTVNAMGEFLVDANGFIEFDKKQFANALAQSYGLEGLEFRSEEDKIKEYKRSLDFQLEKAKLDAEFQNNVQEFLPEQPAPGGQELPLDDIVTTDSDGVIIGA